jgi:translation elongation factor EF-G
MSSSYRRGDIAIVVFVVASLCANLITESHHCGNLRMIEVMVPLDKMVDYADAVQSLSQGRASYSLEPH